MEPQTGPDWKRLSGSVFRGKGSESDCRNLVQLYLEDLQWWRLHHFPEEVIPMSDSLFSLSNAFFLHYALFLPYECNFFFYSLLSGFVWQWTMFFSVFLAGIKSAWVSQLNSILFCCLWYGSGTFAALQNSHLGSDGMQRTFGWCRDVWGWTSLTTGNGASCSLYHQ